LTLLPEPASFPPVSKKPPKVGEASTPYAAKKPAKAVISPISNPAPTDDAAFKRIADKIFTERKELLRKLAQ